MSSLSPTVLISLSVIIIISLLHHAHSPLTVTASSKCPPSPSPPRIVPSKEQAQLKVLVPNITSGSLRQFVDCSDPSHVRGFCIAVFEIALSILIPANLSNSTIHYTCFDFSFIPPNFTDTLTYNDMIGAVADGSYDVVVGDVTITAKRALEVEFTHKYMESGVVIIAKVGTEHESGWKLFGSPFTWPMWCTVVGCFVFTGTLLWIIEHKRHPEFIEGSFGKRVYKFFWFILEALILLERDSIKSTTAQLVMVAWVFVVLLLGSSYMAGLSSILTASNLSPIVYDISMLKNSNKNISYRRGSILKDYLETRFHIPKTRLIATRATLDFVGNITEDKVIAIVDELAYANLLLDNLSSFSCNFGITGPQITSEGFGFGVRRGLEWVNPLSIALMNLTESGCLQELEHNYNISGTTSKCSSDSTSQKVPLETSLSLFFPLISLSYLCVITSCIIQLHRRRRRRSENQRSTTLAIDPSIVLAQHETTQRHRNQELELSIFPQT